MDTMDGRELRDTLRRYLLGTLPDFAHIQVDERLEYDGAMASVVDEVRDDLRAQGLLPEEEAVPEDILTTKPSPSRSFVPLLVLMMMLTVTFAFVRFLISG